MSTCALTQASVCLRCQVQLLSRYSPRSRAISALRTANYSSTPQQRVHASNESRGGEAFDSLDADKKPFGGRSLGQRNENEEAKIGGPTSRELDGDDHRVESLPRRGVSKHHHPRGRTTYRPVSRVRGKQGKEVREYTSKLEVPRLGKPAEILVFRDANLKRSEPESKPRQDSAETTHKGLSEEDIEAFLVSARSEPKADEIMASVEGHRPKSETSTNQFPCLSQSEFEKLVSLLVDGFKSAHLLAYVLTQRKRQQREQAECQRNNPNRIKSRTAWFSRHPSSYQLGSDGTPKLPLKTKLQIATAILRECWKVKILEELEDEGELSLDVRPWHAKLLMAGDAPLLRRIGEHRHASIQIMPSGNTIRITAPERQAMYAADDIESILMGAVISKMPHRMFARFTAERLKQPAEDRIFHPLRRHDVDLIAQATGTYISFVPSEGLRIYAKDSTSAQDAQRSLLFIFAPKLELQNRGQISVYPSDVERKDGMLLPQINQENLSLNQRRQPWARWVMPVPKATESAQITEPLLSALEEDSELPLDGSLTLSRRPKSIPSEGEVIVEHRALFGHVLHPCKPASQHKLKLAVSLENLKRFPDNDRCFSPSVPGVTNYIDWMAFQQHSTGNHESAAKLKYRFIPSPWSQEAKDAKHLPELEITVLIDEAKKSTIQNVSFVLGDLAKDVLLPTRVSDVCIRSRVLFCPSNLEKLGLLKVVSKIKDMIGQEGHLRGPTDFNVTVPNRCRRVVAVDNGIAFSLSKSAPSSHRYQLAGIHFQQSLDLGEFEGHNLVYEDVEGGLTGGKRIEFGLRQTTAVTSTTAISKGKDQLTSSTSLLLRATLQLLDQIQQVGSRASLNEGSSHEQESALRQASSIDVVEESPIESTKIGDKEEGIPALDYRSSSGAVNQGLAHEGSESVGSSTFKFEDQPAERQGTPEDFDAENIH